MDDIVKNLQTIQEDLVGIVLPVVVTSCVSFVIVLINTMKEIFLQRAGFKFEQFKLMQEFYPQFKGYLLELKIIAEEIEDIPIVSDLQHAINKYIEIRKNERQYRTVHDDEIPYIDNFIKKMKCFSKKFTELNDYFLRCTIPKNLKICFKENKDVYTMLKLLQYHSLLWSKYENNDINVEVFREEMVTVGALSLSKKKLEEYNALLDTWFKKY